MILVETEIVEVDGGTTDEYLTQNWFAYIYSAVNDWYRDRYPALRKSHALKTRRGWLLMFGSPFVLNVPLVRSEVETEGETAWFYFLSSIEPEEDPLSFVDSPPNIRSLRGAPKAAISAKAGRIATRLRRIHTSSYFVKDQSRELQLMRSGIDAHLDKVVEDITSLVPARLGIALWELHLACEKSLKHFLAQRGVRFPRSHDLHLLAKLGIEAGLATGILAHLRRRPDGKEVIEHRYSALTPPRLRYLERVYEQSLSLILTCAEAVPQTVRFGEGARILIRKAPWLRRDS